MVWFRIDDRMGTSTKVLSIPRRDRRAAIGLWTLTGAWSAHELTDGRIPQYVVDEYDGTPEEVAHLVRVGLWHDSSSACEDEECQDIGPDEYVYHDWHDYQPAREEVLAKREELSKKRADAGRKGAAKRWQKDGNAMANGMANDGEAMATVKQDDAPVPVPVPVPQSSTDVELSDEAKQLAKDVTMLCNLLADQIAANGSKRPTIGKAWHTSARLMLTADNRDVKKTANLIVWAQQHHFWRSRIMGMPKFRSEYDAMRLQAIADTAKRAPRGQMPAERAQQTMALADVVEQARGGQRAVGA